MRTRSILLTLLILLLPFMSACNRNKEPIPSAAKTEAGRDKVQDYPSTRTDENQNPAVGGTDAPATSSNPTRPGPGGK